MKKESEEHKKWRGVVDSKGRRVPIMEPLLGYQHISQQKLYREGGSEMVYSKC